ncbi:HET-domain-containing protein [Diplogelasinospora grovesii]|uniref:HET-domain-containing protein n=1 Tax=Diplogelasinospora grovesii TaxID=303347 RepID=A0AAN6MV51_9PEZI|nr:HET-domain-containing protein [Diplogelasinospora grovesii]
MSRCGTDISKLCVACARCFDHLWGENHHVAIKYYPHNTIRLVKESARFGCRFCEYMTLVLRLHHHDFDQHDDIPLQMYIPGAKAWSSYRWIHLNWHPVCTWEAYKLTQVCHPFGEKEVPRALLAARNATDFGGRTDSTFCKKLAARWLTNCLTTHTHCRQSSYSAQRQSDRIRWTPTRLLQIERWDSGLVVRVIHPDRDMVGPLEAYITLSHCWGDKQPAMLLEGNLRSYENGLHVSRLPKTFRHAIEIDSLCIIQKEPSNADWTREAKRMHDVYAYGLLNLAASTAPDADTGLFTYRDPYISCKSILQLTLTHGNVVLIPEPDILAVAVTGGPLARRGWVLQEQLLARRVLHFGDQLFWECAEIWACETLPDGPTDALRLLGSPWYFSIRQRILGILRPQFHWVPSARQEALYNVWDEICTEYSRRNLTRQSDKLIAFMGIVKHFTLLLSPDDPNGYAAGLWKGDLIPGLLWYNENSKIPSWSWLSQDGEISYSSKERRHGYYLARLEGLSVDACINDATNSPGDSYVTIFGVLRSAILRCTTFLPAADNSYVVLFDGHIALSSGYLREGTNHARIILDITDAVELGTCYFLPLVVSEDTDRRRKILHGIILSRVSVAGAGVYRRTGYFETTAFARFFYRIDILSPSDSAADNPWEALERDMQADDETTREQSSLDCVNNCINETDQGKKFVSRTQFQKSLRSYQERIFQPLQEETITIL